MNPQAQRAIKAAKLRKTVGQYASWRYAQKRGVPMMLYALATVLEEQKK
jgi:hypothetical protein